jgi:hypothetical protein
MKKHLKPLLCGATALVAASATLALASPFSSALVQMNIAVYGDAPYGTTPTDTSETLATPAFIQAINSQSDIGLVLHVGDIHSGKQFCTLSYDGTIFELWRKYQRPLVYTPGDNEWADCHKYTSPAAPGEGGGLYDSGLGQIVFDTDARGNLVDYQGGNPIANLAKIRSIFFPQVGKALGGGNKDVLSQAQAFDPAHPTDAQYVENVMWEQSGVLFVTLNLPGGSNDDKDIWYKTPTISADQTTERNNRRAANIRWLDAAFARASADHAKAIVIQEQADMWDLDGKATSHITEYELYINDIVEHANPSSVIYTPFTNPILLLDGDSHIYRSDNPLMPSSGTNPCVVEKPQPAVGPKTTDTIACGDDDYAHHPAISPSVPNFHRITVHGSTFPLEYTKLHIDPSANVAGGSSTTAFGPFSWIRVLPLESP